MLINGGVAINILLVTMLKRFEKIVEDLIPHNIVVFDYSGKTSGSQGKITLNLMVDSRRIPTIFIIVLF